MARTAIPVTQVTPSGVEPAAQIAGDTTNNNVIEANDGDVILEVVNSDSEAAHAVTISTPRTVGGINVEEDTVTVAASSTKWIGPFPPQVFNQSNGSVNVNPAHNKLKFRAFRV